jgi:hypothetical protein
MEGGHRDLRDGETPPVPPVDWSEPSRWARLVGGAPDVPSSFTIGHPRSWLLASDGRPLDDGMGRASSVHYPEVAEFFRSMLRRPLTGWPIDLGREDGRRRARVRSGRRRKAGVAPNVLLERSVTAAAGPRVRPRTLMTVTDRDVPAGHTDVGSLCSQGEWVGRHGR